MIRVDGAIEHWPLIEPFEIAGQVLHTQSVVHVTLRDADGREGHGEAAGIDYDGETPESMLAQIEAVAARVAAHPDPAALADWLPHGGARNALDCALWDLAAKQRGVPAWAIAGLASWRPLVTAYTIGLCDEAELRRRTRAVHDWPLLKLKVDGERHLDVVRIAREECPGARLLVDANQAWSRDQLDRLAPALAALGVELIEQPLPRGAEAELDGYRGPVTLAADESCMDRRSLPALAGRYQGVNIKLDKTGGLTEALALAHEARRQGFKLMVGNMCGSSLAMAPGFLVGQGCDWVDLDGPLLQREDRAVSMRYAKGVVEAPAAALWG
jgi:L-alanine-DL-glutamate epimerase-like enolase superfamily enzyme